MTTWIDQEEARSRLTRAALADVDAGHVIDHQAVQAWADSLDTEQALPGTSSLKDLKGTRKVL